MNVLGKIFTTNLSFLQGRDFKRLLLNIHNSTTLNEDRRPKNQAYKGLIYEKAVLVRTEIYEIKFHKYVRENPTVY